MSMTNAFETAFLNLLFKNTNIANIGDATGLRASVAGGNLYISLHTADPGEAGDQSTSEATFTGYARVAVARGAGFTVAGNNAENAAAITFAQCTAGANTITHWGIGTDLAGAGNLLIKGSFAAPLNVSAGIFVEIGAGNLDVNID